MQTSEIEHARHKHWATWAAIGLIAVFVISGVATLKFYGMTWDEGLGNLFFGERYLFYLTTFRESFVDFKAELPIHNRPLNLFLSPMREFPHEFPPVTDTLSAASMHLLSYTLGWMDAVDAFHFFKIALAGMFLWFLYRFVREEWGTTAGLFSVFFLAFFPRFWGDMHFNPKDIPETIWFGLLVLAYYNWLKRRGAGQALLVGALFAAALGTKANAAFAPMILMLGLWQVKLPAATWKESVQYWLRDAWQYALMGATALALYVGSWPFVYVQNNPVSAVRKYFEFILSQGGRAGGAYWSAQPLIHSLTTIPLWMLAFLLIGMGVSVRMMLRKESPKWRLLLVWLVFPIARISMPGMVNFDGIRHYMEYVPAAAILAGIGAQWLAQQVKDLRRRQWALAGIAAGWLVSLVWIGVTLFPHVYIYYSPLIGGVAGARQHFGENEVTDYWASSYRLGMNWLNENVPEGGLVYTPVADYLVDMTAPLWLREDLRVIHADDLKSLLGQKQPLYVMLLRRPGYWNEQAQYVNQHFEPVHVFEAAGQPVLEIYLVEPQT